MTQSPKGPKGSRKGVKQKRRPKIKDKKQSARFIEAARELGATEDSSAFEQIVKELASQKPQPRKSKN